MERLKGKKREIEERLRELVPKDSLIFTILGIGKTLGCIILARVSDVKRFSDKRRFVAYCGLVVECCIERRSVINLSLKLQA